jgi:hypothetical protein
MIKHVRNVVTYQRTRTLGENMRDTTRDGQEIKEREEENSHIEENREGGYCTLCTS